MKPMLWGIVVAAGMTGLCGVTQAQWRCDCTNIVGSCSASASVQETFIEVTSSPEECARVDYLVDGIPFVALVVDGTERQDWIVRSEEPSIIVQSCQVCRDNAGTAPVEQTADAELGTTRLLAVMPTYPESAALAGIEGYVDVEITLLPTGEVATADVVGAEPEGVFESAALASIMRWRYSQSEDPEPRSLTERVEFNINDALIALRDGTSARPGRALARDASFNGCVREGASYDFGAEVGISLINACSEPLLIYSCSTGTGQYIERWRCNDPESSMTLLRSSAAANIAEVSIQTAQGERVFSATGTLELTRAPNSEYWWLACSIGDTACRDDGRQWVRSMDRQSANIDPRDRTRERLGRSF